MKTLQCEHRNHTITASVETHPGIPTPYNAGCLITDPQGHTSRRLSLPVKMAYLADLENAQHAALAHGKWLVDQQLDRRQQLF